MPPSGRWKLIRQRFGIAAPRVEVQTQIPWYWRWAGIAVLLGVAAAAGSWIYDAGRRFAGFDRSEVLQELQTARGELVAARDELSRLRAIANAADSRVSIERTAHIIFPAFSIGLASYLAVLNGLWLLSGRDVFLSL